MAIHGKDSGHLSERLWCRTLGNLACLALEEIVPDFASTRLLQTGNIPEINAGDIAAADASVRRSCRPSGCLGRATREEKKEE